MKKILICLMLCSYIASAQAQDTPLGKNVVKFNLTTPFSFTPTFEFSYEHFMNEKTSWQVNAGFIAGTVSGINLDPVYYQPSPSPIGYRVAVSPRFFVLPNAKATGGVYMAPVLMFKQLLDKYEAQYGMYDGKSQNWWTYEYYQKGTVNFTRNVADFSMQVGYETGSKFVFDFYGGIGIRYRQTIEKNDVVLAYESQKYYRIDPNYYTNDFEETNLSGDSNVKRISYSMPLGVRVGYRF